MPKESPTQKKIVKDVMHDYKKGALKSGGSGKKVKSRKQAVAIALSESGTSKKKSASENKRALKHTKAKKAAKSKTTKGAAKRKSSKKTTPRARATTRSSGRASARR